MKNIKDNFEKEQIRKLTSKKKIPNFRVGDTVKVNVKVVEGERSRIQAFEGICIAKKNAGLNSSFTVRKISYGEGIERIFPFFSPSVDSINIIKQGDVKRAKLYYLRNRSGKNTRIADKNRGEEKDLYEISQETEAEATVAKDDSEIKEEKEIENKESVKDKEQKIEPNKDESEKIITESDKVDDGSKS